MLSSLSYSPMPTFFFKAAMRVELVKFVAQEKTLTIHTSRASTV